MIVVIAELVLIGLVIERGAYLLVRWAFGRTPQPDARRRRRPY